MANVLEIQDLKTHFFTREGVARAVDGVSLHIEKGEILGVVGESGCGKSVTAISILRLVPRPGRIVSGQILFQGEDLLRLPAPRMRQIRGDRISMIFQEPMNSLNPAYTIGDQLTEALRVHRNMTKKEARERAVEMLGRVEIADPRQRMRDYPHHLSGGMRQRVMIAEALLLNPDVLLADEPTTALDVTVQAHVLDLVYRLGRERGTAILLITHNLGLVAEYARRVAVMYAGRVVEEGPVEAIFGGAAHPYTIGLLKSIPARDEAPDAGRRPLYEMKGIVPSLFDMPAGCPFHPRCSVKKERCDRESPAWIRIGPGHHVLCRLFSQDGDPR